MSAKSFFKGLAAGAVIGAAVGIATGLLNAPKSGKELRKDLELYYKDMSKDLAKVLKNAKKMSKEAYEKAVDEVTALYNKAKKFDKEDMIALKDKLMEGWESFADGVLNSTKDGSELRKEVANFLAPMRADIEKILKTAKKVTVEVYENAVDEVTEMYNKVKEFDKKDLAALKKKLMADWEVVVKKFTA